MSKPQVLVLGDFVYAKKELAELMLEFDIVHDTSQNREEFFSDLETKHKDVEIIIRLMAPKHYRNVNEEYVSHLPKSLRGFVICSSGYNDVDVEALSNRNIWITNTPSVVDDAAADIALFLLLGAIRNFWPSQKAVRAGEWRKNASIGNNPKGKVIGILGLGGVGKAVAKRVIALGMTIQYNNRNRLDESIEQTLHAQYVPFSTLISTSDVIFVSLSLNPSTTYLIGKNEIEQMKKGVIIINVARGKILDETAIVDGLENGQIGSVGLDVFENEPEIHPGLLANDHVMLLPHLGTYTHETMREMELLALRNAESLLRTKKPFSPINQLIPLTPPKQAATTFEEAEASKEDVEPTSGENAFWMISKNPKRASKLLSQLEFSDLEIKMF